MTDIVAGAHYFPTARQTDNHDAIADGRFIHQLDQLRELKQFLFEEKRLIPLSQVNQDLGLAGQIRNGAGFEFVGRS